MDRDDAEAPPRAADILGVRVDADGVVRQLAEQGSEIVDERSINVVSQEHEIGPLGLYQICDLADHFFTECDARWIAGIDKEECLDLGIFQLLELGVCELEAVLLRSLDGDERQPVVFKVGQLKVGGKDWRAQRDRVSGMQQAIGLHRFEDVAHRSRAALDRVQVELACRSRYPAHRPHQVLVHDALVVDQHAVGDRVIVADDRIYELVDKGIRLEPERFYRKRHHL